MTAQPGTVVDFPDEEGRALVAGNYGVEIKGDVPADVEPAAPVVEEVAAVAPPENAARRIGRPRGRHIT